MRTPLLLLCLAFPVFAGEIDPDCATTSSRFAYDAPGVRIAKERDDPRYPGLKLRTFPTVEETAPRGRGITWYVLAMRAKVRLHPKYFQLFGVSNVSAFGRVGYEAPTPEGINRRIEDLQKAKSPFAPHVRVLEDKSERGMPALTIMRNWAKNGSVPISKEGLTPLHELHYHDFEGHFWGYALLPKDFVDESRARAKELVARFDKAKDLKEIRELEDLMREESTYLDEITGAINANVWATDPLAMEEEAFGEMVQRGLLTVKAIRERKPQPDMRPAMREFHRKLKKFTAEQDK